MPLRRHVPFALLVLGPPLATTGCGGRAADAPADTLAPVATLEAELAAALAREDLDAVHRVVAAARSRLGRAAGVPDVTEARTRVPADQPLPDAARARTAWRTAADDIARLRWWRIGLDPARTPRALREPANVISGAVTAARAGLEGADETLALAREAGDFLLWAQAQAGTGVLPFPAVRGITGDNAFVSADRQLARAAREGRTGEMVHAGWIASDPYADGGLQFDNAEGGVALLDLWQATGDPRYRDGALRAADWVTTQPLVPNWNYNAFGVMLLAAAAEATGESRYADAAARRAVLGVLPGQLRDGAHAGRWLDGHNARTVYHYIMLRALARLAAVLPRDDARRAAVVDALALGLRARNAELVEQGIVVKDHALEALLVVQDRFADDPAFLATTRTPEAIAAIGRLVARQWADGASPLGPRAWAAWLASRVP